MRIGTVACLLLALGMVVVGWLVEEHFIHGDLAIPGVPAGVSAPPGMRRRGRVRAAGDVPSGLRHWHQYDFRSLASLNWISPAACLSAVWLSAACGILLYFDVLELAAPELAAPEPVGFGSCILLVGFQAIRW